VGARPAAADAGDAGGLATGEGESVTGDWLGGHATGAGLEHETPANNIAATAIAAAARHLTQVPNRSGYTTRVR
jgi:hypothetical protein